MSRVNRWVLWCWELECGWDMRMGIVDISVRIMAEV